MPMCPQLSIKAIQWTVEALVFYYIVFLVFLPIDGLIMKNPHNSVNASTNVVIVSKIFK